MKPYEVLYICGHGHSGSTILDIVLGSSPNAFSAGEVSYIIRDGFLKEYCSCGDKIGECPQWKPIFDEWFAEMEIEFGRYRALRTTYEGNKATLRVLWNLLIPSKSWKMYVRATEQLYDAIHAHTGASRIIDSSKPATRIALLRQFTRVRPIHLMRNFAGVLNSEKKDVKANIKRGIESSSPPKATHRVLASWLSTNASCMVFGLLFGAKRLTFKSFVARPDTLRRFNPDLGADLAAATFTTEHMVAGNAIRMKPAHRLETGRISSYARLSPRERVLARIVDAVFWFWN